MMERFWPGYSGWSSPFTELERMRREMDRLFETVAGHTPTAGVFPLVNVTQDPECYYIRAELPGVQADRIEVTAAHNSVAISGTRERPREDEKVSYHRRERPEGAFRRTVTLPGDFDSGKIEARHVDGVLMLSLPKAAASRPKQIPVKAS